MRALGLVVLRLTLAANLVAHGAHGLFGLLSGPGVGPGGLTSSSAYFSAMGLTPGFAFAVMSGLVQLVGGALIGLGLLTRASAASVVTLLVLQIWKAQWRWGFFLNWVLNPAQGHGVEFSVLLIGALLCLILGGAGEWSFDGRRAQTAASRASARARLRTRG